MAARSVLKYHELMPDPSGELYEVVVEALALLQSLRLQGVVLVPAAQNVAVAGRVAPTRPEVGASARVERPDLPARPAAVPVPTRSAGASFPTSAAPSSTIRSPLSPPASTPVAAPDRPAGGSLLGKWGERLIPADERLAKVLNELGPTCETCGQPTLSGAGGLTSGLVLLAAPATGEAAVMLANMLL